MAMGALPRIWLEEAFDALPAAERRNGDVAVCINSTVTPTFKIWRNGGWHLAIAETAELNITVVDTYGLSGLQGFTKLVEDTADGRHIALLYNDNGTMRTVAEDWYPYP